MAKASKVNPKPNYNPFFRTNPKTGIKRKPKKEGEEPGIKPDLSPFRGEEEYEEKTLPPELKALCKKP